MAYQNFHDARTDLENGVVELSEIGKLLERIEGRVDEIIVQNATRIKGGGDLVEGVRFENRTRREIRKLLGLNAVGDWPSE